MIKLEIDISQLKKSLKRVEDNISKTSYADVINSSWPILKPVIEKFLDENYSSFQALVGSAMTSSTTRKQKLIGTPIEVGMGMKRAVVSTDPLEMTRYLRESATRLGDSATTYRDVIGGVGEASLEAGLKVALFKEGYPSRIQELIERHGGSGLYTLTEDQINTVTEIIGEFLYRKVAK